MNNINIVLQSMSYTNGIKYYVYTFVVKGGTKVSTSASRVWFPVFGKNFKTIFFFFFFFFYYTTLYTCNINYISKQRNRIVL